MTKPKPPADAAPQALTGGITIEAAQLARAMKNAAAIVQGSQIMPILANVRLFADGDGLELTTSENGCSSWPTVRTSDTNGPGSHGDGGPDLRTVASNWPTPMAGSAGTDTYNAAGNIDFSRKAMALAEGMANLWVTPNVPNGGRAPTNCTVRGRSAYREDGSKVQVDLQHQTRTWSTPRASDGEKGDPNQSFGAGGTPLPAMAGNFNDGEDLASFDARKTRLDMIDWQAEHWSRSHSAPQAPQSQIPLL